MDSEGADWSRLLQLVSMEYWTQREAVFIVAGLDPATDWNKTEAIIWLPDGILPDWIGLAKDQLLSRATRAVEASTLKLRPIKQSVAPHLWLYEAMRRSLTRFQWEEKAYVHPGLNPPWIAGARERKEFNLLIPPELYPQAQRAKAKHSRSSFEKNRRIIRRLWDSYSLNETSFKHQTAFIQSVLAILDEKEPGAATNEGTVRDLILQWQLELFTPYGVVTPKHGSPSRGYYSPTIMDPAKRKN